MDKYFLTAMCLGATLLPDRVVFASQTMGREAIASIARQTTVRISSGANNYGSGVVIQKRGNEYILLTAKHVVAKKGKVYSQLKLLTTTGGRSTIKDVRLASKDVDLAIVRFTSDRSLPVAKIARNSDEITEGMAVYVSGYPLGTDPQKNIYSFLSGTVAANSSQPINAYGYSMVYSNNTLPGQSGGPVWNDRGEIVAIHGMGDTDARFLEETGSRQGRVKTGFNLGIGTNILLRQTKNLRLAGLPPAPIAKVTPIDDAIVSARLKYEQGDYLGAIRDYERAIKLDPNRSEVYTLRGGARLTTINRKLLKLVAQEIKTGPADIGGVFDTTVYRRYRSEYNLVLADYERSIQLEPQALDAQYALAGAADIYNKLGEFKQALARIDRAIEFSPTVDSFYVQRALIHGAMGNYQRALPDLDRAIAIKPQAIEYRVQKYYNYNNLKQYPAAISELDKAIKIDPNRSYIYSQRAAIKFFQLKDDAGAIADLSKAIDLTETNRASDDKEDGEKYQTRTERLALYYRSRGSYHTIKSRSTPALADINKAIGLEPNNYTNFQTRSFIYEINKDYTSALADLDRALRLAPQSANSYQSQGNIYRKLSRYPLAIARYTDCINLVKNNKTFRSLLEECTASRAEIYGLDRQYSQAIADYNRAIELNPNNSTYYLYRGNTYYDLKQYKSTVADLDRVIKLIPNDPVAYILQGSAYLELTRADLALMPLQQGVNLTAKNPADTALLGNALANLGAAQYLTKKSDARANLDRAIKLINDSPKAFYYRGLLRADTGDKQGAIADLEAAAKLYLQYKSQEKYQLVRAKLQQLNK
jgi:tetratricopeptide (TPR) repeat protein